MPSTVIRRFTYRPGQNALDIEFQTGRRYRYFDVERQTAEDMQAAFSKGEFFNARIRDRYRFERIDEAAADPFSVRKVSE